MSNGVADTAASTAAATTDSDESLYAPFIRLSEESRELYLDRTIPRISVPSPLVFYRDYIARNKPVIITGALNDWPALRLWPMKGYLRSKVGQQQVTIDAVPLSFVAGEERPRGYGDAVVEGKVFVTPEERRMKFAHFLDWLEGKHATAATAVTATTAAATTPPATETTTATATTAAPVSSSSSSSSSAIDPVDPLHGFVLYCQHQNNSLSTEFSSLLSDIRPLQWAQQALGGGAHSQQTIGNVMQQALQRELVGATATAATAAGADSASDLSSTSSTAAAAAADTDIAIPDATNLWVGSDYSITTLHHDPYENLYCVVQGCKRFLLYPPEDTQWLDKREYHKCKWQYRPKRKRENAAGNADAAATGAADAPAPTASAAAKDATASASTAAASTDDDSGWFLLPSPHEEPTAWFDLEPHADVAFANAEQEGEAEERTKRERGESEERNERTNSDSVGDDHTLSSTRASTSTSTAPVSDKYPHVRFPLRVSPDVDIPLPPLGPSPPYETHPPLPQSMRKKYANPIVVDVRAGEVLYLPSLWFHRVSQSGEKSISASTSATSSTESSDATNSPKEQSSPAFPNGNKTIAVNYWFDMQYDRAFNNYRFLESIAEEKREARAAAYAARKQQLHS